MNGNTIFTRKKFGLDRKVWLVMLLVCIGCIGLLGYKMVAVEPCKQVTVLVKNDVGANKDFHPNDALRFTAFMDGSTEVIWDFGDKTKTEISGPTVSHAFKTAGDYVVTATVNDKCTESIAVKILRNKPVVDSTPVFLGNVIVPSNRFPQVGEKVSFSSNMDAKQYEWSIEGDAMPAKKEKMATYEFALPQAYIVKLKLDNDPNKTYSIPIMVAPAPKANQPAPISNVPRILVPDNYPPYVPPASANNQQPEQPKPAEVKPDPKRAEPTPEGPVQPPKVYYYKNTDQFKDMLREVITGDKNVRDFERYLCDGPNTKVTENGTQTTFLNLCQNLAGEKKIEIIDVIYLDITTFADKSRCVKELKVIYKKPRKGLFGHR